MSYGNVATDNSFVVPDSENLKNLGPGCFVRTVYQSQNVWVEVSDVDGEQLRGVLRPFSPAAGSSVKADLEVQLQKEQINALGCDRFCYCD